MPNLPAAIPSFGGCFLSTICDEFSGDGFSPTRNDGSKDRILQRQAPSIRPARQTSAAAARKDGPAPRNPPQLIAETTLLKIEYGDAPHLRAFAQRLDFSAVSAFASATFEDRVRSLRHRLFNAT
jgi:hypothetical protein